MRALKGTPAGEEATRKWRETMAKKYGSVSDKMGDIGSIGGKKGKAHGVIKGFARMTKEQRSAAGHAGGTASRKKAQV